MAVEQGTLPIQSEPPLSPQSRESQSPDASTFPQPAYRVDRPMNGYTNGHHESNGRNGSNGSSPLILYENVEVATQATERDRFWEEADAYWSNWINNLPHITDGDKQAIHAMLAERDERGRRTVGMTDVFNLVRVGPDPVIYYNDDRSDSPINIIPPHETPLVDNTLSLDTINE